MTEYRSWRLDALAVSLFILTAAFLVLMLGSRPGNAEYPLPAAVVGEAVKAPVRPSRESGFVQEVSLDSQRRILAIVSGE